MKTNKIFMILIIMSFLTLVGCKKDAIDDPILVITIKTDYDNYCIGDSIIVDVAIPDAKFSFSEVELDAKNAEIVGNVVIPNSVGELEVIAKYNNLTSNVITLNISESKYDSDPYINVSGKDFYSNYQESINPQDSYYRSIHGYMSGDLELPDQRPILADNQPKKNDKYIRNTTYFYSHDNTAYYITDSYGEIVDVVFETGGYISLDEVAAYVFAFGYTPENYIQYKSADPSTYEWGKYLRLNNSSFSGSTSKYPYEPELPNISGCGGDLYYYEIDFGTTGTDCDPKYYPDVYNDGYDITRGAARIVYTRYDKNRNEIIDPEERYVFYTYNHYNDFQEYLNYQGGWGKMFGNVTGGGTLSSKYDYNPTPYVEVERLNFYLNNIF